MNWMGRFVVGFLFLGAQAHSAGLLEDAGRQEGRAVIPVCSATVAWNFKGEVDLPGKPDKFKHCSLSCVMTLYCGPIGSFEVGALKELYDALGFGDPDAEDLRADLKGIKAGLRIGWFGDREKCYRACGTLFP